MHSGKYPIQQFMMTVVKNQSKYRTFFLIPFSSTPRFGVLNLDYESEKEWGSFKGFKEITYRVEVKKVPRVF